MKLFDIKVCCCETLLMTIFFLADWLGAFLWFSLHVFICKSKSLNFICKRNNEMKKGVLHKGRRLMKFIFERLELFTFCFEWDGGLRTALYTAKCKSWVFMPKTDWKISYCCIFNLLREGRRVNQRRDALSVSLGRINRIWIILFYLIVSPQRGRKLLLAKLCS